MLTDPKMWLRWARIIATKKHDGWLEAMEAELSEISGTYERRRFGFGCFTTILQDAARSRRGLNYIARGIGAFLIFIMSTFGIWSALKFGNSAEAIAASRLVIGLCLFYIISAGLLITSLKYLQVYAKTGFVLAMLAAGWCVIGNPDFKTLPTGYLTAIGLEMAGFMLGLLCAAIYLNWLYDPETDDV